MEEAIEENELVKERIVYPVSKHAKERYVERIMGYTNQTDIAKHVSLDGEKIVEHINTLCNYAEKIYTGYIKGHGIQDVYKKDNWILFADPKLNTIITLYKVEFGFGDDLDKEYMARAMEKLEESKKELEEVCNSIIENDDNYKKMIEDNEAHIKELQSSIDNLNKLNDGLRDVLENESEKVKLVEYKISDIVHTMVRNRNKC